MKKSTLKFFNGTRFLYGGAAQLAYVKANGGWDEYHEKLVENVTYKVYREILKEQSKSSLRIAK